MSTKDYKRLGSDDVAMLLLIGGGLILPLWILLIGALVSLF